MRNKQTPAVEFVTAPHLLKAVPIFCHPLSIEELVVPAGFGIIYAFNAKCERDVLHSRGWQRRRAIAK
jgi:hypothetical protein